MPYVNEMLLHVPESDVYVYLESGLPKDKGALIVQ